MRTRASRALPSGLSLLGLVLAVSCTQDAWIGADKAALGGAGGTLTGLPDGGATSSDSGTCHLTMCGNHLYECGNCIDDDQDGKIDMDDPDCTGPCQNAEDRFVGSIPGQSGPACSQDCYFDQDSGVGNDDCEWSHKCDPLAPEGSACAYDPKAKLPRGETCAAATATQSDKCRATCGPLTPNGCDCFGCCRIAGAPPVWLGSVDDQGNPSCDLAHAGDPSRCKPCTQVEGCLNPCAECELCVGKRALPASCSTASPTCVAPDGRNLMPCGLPSLAPCVGEVSCITGCCQDLPILR